MCAPATADDSALGCDGLAGDAHPCVFQGHRSTGEQSCPGACGVMVTVGVKVGTASVSMCVAFASSDVQGQPVGFLATRNSPQHKHRRHAENTANVGRFPPWVWPHSAHQVEKLVPLLIESGFSFRIGSAHSWTSNTYAVEEHAGFWCPVFIWRICIREASLVLPLSLAELVPSTSRSQHP